MVNEGQILTARVASLTGGGTRVLLPPQTIADLAAKHLSWKRKNQKAGDYFDVGDEILVKVLSVKQRVNKMPKIEVGFRETEPNPWPLIRSIHPEGSFSNCHVVTFLPFGAYVLLASGFDALLHEKELSWDREIKHADDTLKLGQQLRVQIKAVFPEEQKIHVSLKDAAPNPWEQFAEEKPELKPAIGIVSGIAPYGLFVKLPNGCVGLIHKSRVPDKLRDEFALGDRVDVRVISLTADRQRVELEFNVEAIYGEWERVLEAGSNEEALPKDFGAKVIEGAKRVVSVNYYERNPGARRQCIQYHGTSCAVCGFSFVKTYGQIGEGFIHVHHLQPIGEIGSEYALDPIRDLRPVCANCHGILHRRRPPFSIEELRQTLLEHAKR